MGVVWLRFGEKGGKLFHYQQILPVGSEGRGAVVAADAVGVVAGTLGGEAQEIASRFVDAVHYGADFVLAAFQFNLVLSFE